MRSPSSGRPQQQRRLMATILVIDDEPIVLDLIAAALQMQGHNVIALLDPLSALDSSNVAPAAIDLLVTDISMKPISGFEVVKHLNQLGFNGPVLYMSGHSSLAAAIAGTMGEAAVIEKPFTVEQLRSAVGRALSTIKQARNSSCGFS
jgi:two-component system OmpR family response regulator